MKPFNIAGLCFPLELWKPEANRRALIRYLREVRRLRGEVGRAMFYENLEREAFGDVKLATYAAIAPERPRNGSNAVALPQRGVKIQSIP